MALSVVHRTAKPASIETPLLVLFATKGGFPGYLGGLDTTLAGALTRCWSSGDFTGARDETALLYPAGAIARVLLIGLGSPDEVNDGALRRAAMIAGKRARTVGTPAAVLAYFAAVAPRVAPGERDRRWPRAFRLARGITPT